MPRQDDVVALRAEVFPERSLPGRNLAPSLRGIGVSRPKGVQTESSVARRLSSACFR